MNEKKEEPKVLVAVCKNCAHPIEVVVPDYLKKPEPCACGLTENARIGRYVAACIIAFFLCILMGCPVYWHYSTEQVKAVKGSMEIRHNENGAPILPYSVQEKKGVEKE